MKKISALFLFILIVLSVQAQEYSTIKGKVVTHEDKPAAYVTIQAAKTTTQTNENGEYVLQLSASVK